MVKIKDIAERCNLSVASVSKALHGKSDINPDTAEFVRKVAREMGYVPNASARMLKTNHSYMIGILFEDDTNSGLKHEYFSSIISAIRDECGKRGYDITFVADRFGDMQCTYYQHAKYRNCDGVIVATADYKKKEVIELVESDIPTVTIDYDFNGHSSVDSDNVHGVSDIIKYVTNMGHEKIAFIHGELTLVTQMRVNSFYRACEAIGINVPDEYIKQGRYHIPKVSSLATRELLELKNRPTCIIYPDDYSLLGGMTEIEKHGLKIPEDISVVGYDGITLSKLMRPEFTTYVQNSFEIGTQAAKKLIDLIEKPKTTISEVIAVKGYLQPGSTVKKLS